MIKIYAQCVCGCCIEEMAFHDVESANKAFDKAGLASSEDVVDDTGVEHEGIDTFYGFVLEVEEKDKHRVNWMGNDG